MQIDVLVDVKTTIGEGPVWDVQEQRLYWIDVVGCRVFRCTADGREVRAWDMPEPIGSMALRRGGGAVLSLATGFHFLDFNTGDTQLIVNPEPDKPHTRLNDGKVDARGRFIVGSMDTREGGTDGALFRLDPDLSLEIMNLFREINAVRPSISPTPSPVKSGHTTTTSRPAPSPTGAPSRRRASRPGLRPMDRRSTPKDFFGMPRSSRASCAATRPTAAWIASSRCRSRR